MEPGGAGPPLRGPPRARASDADGGMLLPRGPVSEDVMVAISERATAIFSSHKHKVSGMLEPQQGPYALALVGAMLGLNQKQLDAELQLTARVGRRTLSYEEFMSACEAMVALHGALAQQQIKRLPNNDMSGALRSAFNLYVKLNVGGFVGGDQRMNSNQFTKMCQDAGMMEPNGPASMMTLQISWASCKATFGSTRLQYNQFLKVIGALAAELSGDVFLLVTGLGLQLPTVPPLRNGFRKPDAGEVNLPKPEVVQGVGAHVAAEEAYEKYMQEGRMPEGKRGDPLARGGPSPMKARASTNGGVPNWVKAMQADQGGANPMTSGQDIRGIPVIETPDSDDDSPRKPPARKSAAPVPADEPPVARAKASPMRPRGGKLPAMGSAEPPSPSMSADSEVLLVRPAEVPGPGGHGGNRVEVLSAPPVGPVSVAMTMVSTKDPAAATTPGDDDPDQQVVIVGIEFDEKAEAPPPPPPPAAAGAAADAAAAASKRRNVAWIALGVLLVVAAGVGVGVGVGVAASRKKGNNSHIYTSIDLGRAVEGRTYFIAADQISWDYASSGQNLCYNNEMASKYTAGFSRVGGIFAKAQYREYTDSSFETLKPRPAEWAHLGNLGPHIRASVGDVIRIVFKNNLPGKIAVNMAPNGGVVAWDGAGGRSSARVQPVAPGDTVTYLWLVPPEAGPAPGSTVTSQLWLYSSSVDPKLHDNAGLVGPIIVTAKGASTTADGRPADVDRELVVLFQVVNERESDMFPYANTSQLSGVSYTKMAMNGYVWCNMPKDALSMSVGQRVRWHVASVGSSDGLHNYHWHGHAVELNGHHVDQFTAIPGSTYSVNMVPDEPGAWMIHCHVNYHMDGGMVNLYTVNGNPGPLPSGGTERLFYVAAEEADWSYTGKDNADMCGDTPVVFSHGVQGFQFVEGPVQGGVEGTRLGPILTKTLFVEYTDGSFTKRKERAQEDSYLGMIGPIFRAVVGDTIKVVLLNRASMNVSMHPHGVRYSKDSEGTPYQDGTTANQKLDDVVQPNQTYTYVWKVTERAGPGPRDPSSMLWMYHSHVDETAETYAGLMGAIIVTNPAMVANASSDPRPNDVDRELVLFFSVTNEIESSNFMHNLRSRLGDGGVLAANASLVDELISSSGFKEHMLKHGINGFMYCNMPKLTFLQGQKVRMHVMVLGTQEDMHTPNMGGPRFDYNAQHSDSVQISPGGMISADVVMTAPGEYELQCRVADHVTSGMRAKYRVLADPTILETTKLTGVTRKYYIQADPVEWDYAPEGYKCSRNLVDTGAEAASSTYILKKASTMGSKYRKAVFRAYTDESFAIRNVTPGYYGTMGPTIVVEVGDVLEVHLRNNLADLPEYPINIQMGGGLISSGGENCSEVAPGKTCVYRWVVPVSAGPGAADFSTTVYGYTSTVDVATAPNAGLAGALVVAAAGVLQPSKLQPGSEVPAGIDLMIPLYWQVVNEEQSPYWDFNKQVTGFNETAIDETTYSNKFHEGNLKHAINGFLYCNLPGLSIPPGATVRWLLVAYGTEGDFHAPYFMGQITKVDITGFSTLASLMPSIARAADMRAVDKGTWLLSCAVHDHYVAGMLAQFTVA